MKSGTVSAANRRGTIMVLTYHEITEDARVLKEARVVRDAGWNVHILSAWPQGKPETEILEGMRVTRFDCFATDDLVPAMWEEFTFLDRSRALLEAKLVPLLRDQHTLRERYLTPLRAALGISCCEKMSPAQRKTSALGVLPKNTEEQLWPSYYRKHRGMRRIARKFRHLMAVRRVCGLLAPNGTQIDKNFLIEMMVLAERVRARKRELFQGNAVIYAANATNLILSDKGGPDPIAGVHAHDIYTLPFGVVVSRRLGVPLIYDAHEYEPARATKMLRDNCTLPRDIEDDCFPQVARIITVGNSIADLYSTRFQGPAPTLVMNVPEVDRPPAPNAVDSAAPCPLRAAAGLSANRPLIVYTGGVQNENRGLDKVMAALRHLPAFDFICLGPRLPRDDEWLRGHAEAHGVSGRVTLLPPVPAADVPRAIMRADVAICPIQDISISYRFAMPNKLFEAACAGVPICVSDLPDMRDFVERLRLGRTMNQTDPRCIAEAVRDVFKNRNRYLHGTSAAEAFIVAYGWKKQAQRLVELYDTLLESTEYDTAFNRTERIDIALE